MNLVFGMGAETDKQCRDMLKRLESGKTELSRRNMIPLNIAGVKQDSLLLENGKKLGEELIWQYPEVLKPEDSSDFVPLTERYTAVKTFLKGETH